MEQNRAGTGSPLQGPAMRADYPIEPPALGIVGAPSVVTVQVCTLQTTALGGGRHRLLQCFWTGVGIFEQIIIIQVRGRRTAAWCLGSQAI